MLALVPHLGWAQVPRLGRAVVRGIVNDYARKDGSVYLAPKSPPEQLEDFLGELKKWRSDFVKAQPRLNIPTPKNDDPRHKQVTEWRAESKRILEDIKKVETVLKAAISAVTSPYWRNRRGCCIANGSSASASLDAKTIEVNLQRYFKEDGSLSDLAISKIESASKEFDKSNKKMRVLCLTEN